MAGGYSGRLGCGLRPMLLHLPLGGVNVGLGSISDHTIGNGMNEKDEILQLTATFYIVEFGMKE
jgi:hypothetical protein